jgi:hypothetical protein
MFELLDQTDRKYVQLWISFAWAKWLKAEQEDQLEIKAYLEEHVDTAASALLESKDEIAVGLSVAAFYEEMDDEASTEKWLLASLKLDETYADANISLGRLYLYQGKIEGAEACLARVKPDSPQYEEAASELAESRLMRISNHIKKDKTASPEKELARKQHNATREESLLKLFEFSLKIPGKSGESKRRQIAHYYIKQGKDMIIHNPAAEADFKDSTPQLCITFLKKCKENEKLARRLQKLKPSI